MPVKVLMLDLGETLVHDSAPFPHVPEALAALSEMQTAEGEPLEICLVSDFTMPTPSPSPEKIAAIFEEYLGLLDDFGLRELFEPVEQRVTLSTHAGERKPHRTVFEKAIERLGVAAALSECLFITEKEEHLVAARETLGMETLHFGSAEGLTDWAEAPLLVAARLVAPPPENLAPALGLWLRAKHGAQLLHLKPSTNRKVVRAEVKAPCLLPPAELGGRQVHAELPAVLECRLADDGRVTSMTPAAPSSEAVTEAVCFVKSLQAHGHLAPDAGPLPKGATHQLVEDAEGRTVLKRKRFSAI